MDRTGLPPEEHWELIGRALGRPGRPAEEPRRPLWEVLRAPAPARHVQAQTAHPEAFPIVPTPAGLDWPAAETGRGDPAPAAVAVRASDLELAAFADAAALGAAWPLLATFARLSGALSGDLLRIDRAVWGPALPSLPDDRPTSLVLEALAGGPRALADAWMGGSHHLSLRLGDVEGEAPRAGRLSLFQCDPAAGGAVRRVGDRLMAAAAPAFADAALANPFLPVLAVLSDARGRAEGMALLAFPSLLRGGAHHAELVALLDGGDPMESLWPLMAARLPEPRAATGPRRLLASLDGATGAEPIFSREVGDWLATRGLAVEAAPRTGSSGRMTARPSSCRLTRSRPSPRSPIRCSPRPAAARGSGPG